MAEESFSESPWQMVRQRSFVADVINFKASESPSWRLSEKDNVCPKIDKMIQDIVEFQLRFKELEKNVEEKYLEEVHREFVTEFIFSLNVEEDHGLKTLRETEESLINRRFCDRSLSIEEQETVNIYDAYHYLKDTVQRECKHDQSLYGFIEGSIIKQLHEIILKDLPLPKGMTKPGVCSNNERFTTFNGETYYYKKPGDMEEAMNTVLDRFNSLLNCLSFEQDKSAKVYSLFKTSSWLMFELLDLHPFSDGNGRLCRLLCSYVLSLLTPFPTPIYNIRCKPNTNAYYLALISARKSRLRHPEELTTMIIECNWCYWRKFLKKLQQS